SGETAKLVSARSAIWKRNSIIKRNAKSLGRPARPHSDVAVTSRLVPHDPMTRRLTLATLVNTFGNGLFMTTSALVFTRSVGLAVGQVGLGLTIAGCFGVAATVPAGHLADRWDPRKLFVVLALIEAAGLLSYSRVHSMATFLPAVCLVAVVDRASSTIRNTLIAVALPPPNRPSPPRSLRPLTTP